MNQPFLTTSHGVLYDADCLQVLERMKSEVIDTIFADPPFNIGKDYKNGYNDKLTRAEYLIWCREWILECCRILKPGGAFFLYATPELAVQFAPIMGERLDFRHWIALTMKGTYPRGKKLYPAHYALLYYTRGTPRVFNKLRLPIETCRHCGKEIRDYGGHRNKMNPAGVNLTDFWTDTSPNRHKKFKVRPGVNELKLVIPERAILISTEPGDTVFDPFGGGGSTYQAAEKLHRNWIGTELYDSAHIRRRMDFTATGERAARLALHSGPFTRAAAKVSALMPPTDSTHFAGHLCDLLTRARELERRHEDVLDVCILPVQPWMDIDEMGSSVVVTATGGGVPLDELQKLASEWYAQRHHWRSQLTPWPEILQKLRRKGPEPWVLVDTADATSGGSPGHSAEALRRLLPLCEELPGKVLLWVVDPGTVAAARRGATRFTTGDPPVSWEGRVIWTGEGNYKTRGGAYTGQAFSMGEAAVIESGQIQLVACSYPALTPDPAFYECVGLQPDAALAVMAKNMTGWMAAFDAPWERGLLFDGPGVCTLDFASIPFTGSGRGLWPVDPDPANPVAIWDPDAAGSSQ